MVNEQTEFLLSVVETHEKFLDELGMPYVRFETGNHREIWPVRSKNYRDFLKGEVFKQYAFDSSKAKIEPVLEYVENQCKVSNKTYRLYARVAMQENAVYYDLCNSDWQVVKIDDTGWKVVNKSPILFKRYPNQAEQVRPVQGNSIKQLFKYFRINKKFDIFLLAIIVAMLIPDISHPIVIIYGQPGSGKSTFSRIIKQIIDPSKMDILSYPTNEKDLPQIINKNWLCVFDNIDSISSFASDIFCRVCTGGAFPKRKLFTDDDEITYNLRNCLILNGLNQSVTKNDLLDRCAFFELQPFDSFSRKTDEEFWNSFKADLPSILGKLFDVLSKALGIYNKLTLTTSKRLADFEKWGYSIAEVAGKGDKFSRQFDEMAEFQNNEAIQGYPLAYTVTILMEQQSIYRGHPSDLYKSLCKIARTHNIDMRNSLWPKAENALTRMLNNIANNLYKAGVEYIHEGHKSAGSYITLKKIQK